MLTPPSFPAVTVNLRNICNNYRYLESLCKGRAEPFSSSSLQSSFIPVIKADAYGHGHIPVAKALLGEGATILATGSVPEAVTLRLGIQQFFPASTPSIISLLGILDTHDVVQAVEHTLIPLIHCFEQLPLLAAAQDAPLSIAIKCDSGMGRLGFVKQDIPRLRRELTGYQNVTPVLAISHLAAADSGKGQEELATQAAVFAPMLAALREQWPNLAASLCNSAGTLLAGQELPAIGPHICRSGLALYGYNPFAGTKWEHLGAPLAPAMDVRTPVITVRTMPAGTVIGYGHTYVTPKEMRVGIIAAGYADGFSRGLSGKGKVLVGGVRAPILGRVSMQLSAIDLTNAPSVSVGDMAWLIGGPEDLSGSEPPVTAAELAQDWGTIPYEVLCLLGANLRQYTHEKKAHL